MLLIPFLPWTAFYGTCVTCRSFMVSVVSAVAFLVYIGIVLNGATNVVTLVVVACAIMSAHHYRDLIVRDKWLECKRRSTY